MFDKMVAGFSVFFLAFLAFGVGVLLLQNQADTRTITISNVSGITKVAPDSADISVQINVESNESKEKVAENFANATKNLQNFLAKYGIEAKDIHFDSLHSDEWKESITLENGSETEKTTYFTRQSLSFFVNQNNFSKFQDLYKELAVLKNISIEEIEKKTEKIEDVYDKARENAIAKAKEQAEKMANLAGAKLGKVISIETSNPHDDVAVAEFAMSKASSDAHLSKEVIGMDSEDEYSVSIDVVYEIR